MACYYCEKDNCQQNCFNANFRAPHKDKAKCKCIFCSRCSKPTFNNKKYFDDNKIYCDDCIEWLEAQIDNDHCTECANCLCCACECIWINERLKRV